MPVPVQGPGSAERIAAAIGTLSDSGLVDVIIVGRGGGTWEDLWSFNEEIVVRAIARAAVPVVSAVGHETDVTLADFAADYRSPTPSAAAEAVVPVREEVAARVAQWTGRMTRCMRARCVLHDRRMSNALRVFEVMRRRMQGKAQRVDELTSRMNELVRYRMALLHRRVQALDHALWTAGPGFAVKERRIMLLQRLDRLERHMRTLVNDRRHRLHRKMTGLDALSPLAILSRGYSTIHRLSDNRLVKRWSEVQEGDLVRARLAAGELVCLVQHTMADTSP
jgi:exodeoxyribonuclease VII large subunit